MTRRMPSQRKYRAPVFVTLAVMCLSACSSTLPDFSGRELQAAQDEAQEAGFSKLESEDASGQGREQVWDRNWVVCDQEPKPGEVDSDSVVTFHTVKEDETCPEGSPGFRPRPGDPMPDYVGKSLFDASNQLVLVNGVEEVDASGKNRDTLIATEWKICSQSPAPGEPIEDVVSGVGEEVEDPAITLNAVKTNEQCP